MAGPAFKTAEALGERYPTDPGTSPSVTNSKPRQTTTDSSKNIYKEQPYKEIERRQRQIDEEFRRRFSHNQILNWVDQDVYTIQNTTPFAICEENLFQRRLNLNTYRGVSFQSQSGSAEQLPQGGSYKYLCNHY